MFGKKTEPKTYESITANLRTIADELTQLTVDRMDEAQCLRIQAEALLAEADEADAECSRCQFTVEKIAGLLS
jgi:CHASE3 domain sensor protein